MGSLLIGMGLGLVTATVALIAGMGMALAFAAYVLGGIVGTLVSAGWTAYRITATHRMVDRHATPMSMQID